MTKRCLFFSPSVPLLRSAVLVAAAVFLLLPSCSRQKEQESVPEVVRPVKMLSVASGGESRQRKFPGTVRATQRADLSFQVPGTLVQIPVGEGLQVEKGQLIAQLDQRDFENSLRSAQGQLARVNAALASAQSEYDRILRIQKQDPGAASESMVVKRRESLDKSRAEIQSAQAAVDSARDMLGYTTLRAPFSGFVSRRHVDNFQEVQAKQAIVSLDDMSSLEILVDLPEIVVASLRGSKGDSAPAPVAHAEFAALPGKNYPLHVKEFSTRADPKTQTYQVVLQMDRPEDAPILPGMTATVVDESQTAGSGGESFVVPAIAVFADAQGAANVWVVDKGTMTVQSRQVVTGDLIGTDGIRITGGLQPGDTVAVSGVSQLRPGMKVRPFDGTF